jgi:hypothetical protein
MTQDEIIEMAMAAEFVSHGKPSDEESELFVCVDKDIYKFAKLVAAKEREACATQRTWVGLTDEEIEIIYAECNVWDKFEYERMIEAKLKEKNT